MSDFSLALVQAVSDWMRDCTRPKRIQRALKLSEAAGNLGPQFRNADHNVYRQMTLTSDYLVEAGKRYRLGESVSSWTLNEDVAKELKGGVHPDRDTYMTVIFKIVPPEGSIVLNLAALMSDASFCSAIECYKDQVLNFAQGIGKWDALQQEVALRIEYLSLDDVYAFGGFYRREKQLPAIWEPYGIDPEVANTLFAMTGIVPGAEKWVTNPSAVKRLVGKWVEHASRR